MKNKRFGIHPVRPSTPAISTLVRAADSVVDPHAAACCVQRKRRARRRARTSLTHPAIHNFFHSLTLHSEMPAKGRWDRILGSSRRLSFSTKFRAPPRGLRAQAGAQGGYK